MRGALRIAFINSWRPASFDGSGTAVGIRNLAKGLTLLGHEVSAVRPKGGSAALVYRLLFNLRVPAQLRASAPFHLVVGFDIDGFRWASARGQSSPYVVCLKGIAADEARFSRSRGERVLLATLARMERRNALRADRVFVPSRYSAEVAERTYGIPSDRLAVVPEALDLAPWRALHADRSKPLGGEGRPGAEGARPRWTILSVARQYPRKDTATLLRAMPSVLERHPGARLRVVGGGPELERLIGMARELRIDDSVEFRGAVSSDADVRSAFLDADVFCLPSLQEGFGIAFVEAMAAGLPVVAASAGAAPEVVQDGVTGLLVSPGDPAAVADALNRLLDDPPTRLRMGAEGTRHAERFDLERVARQFLDEVSIRSRPES
jgi:glycosyltransferase involved in cell wall biosynthesis